MVKNDIHQNLAQSLQVIDILLQDLVNHVRVDAVVEMNHPIPENAPGKTYFPCALRGLGAHCLCNSLWQAESRSDLAA